MAQPLEQFEGKYKILAKIGEGGMGAVYKVRHRLLDEVRVIKVMRHQAEDKEQVEERFTREARIAVKLRHPNIAQMYDFAIDEAGTGFIVMEYVDGITLQTVLRRTRPLELGLTLELAQQALKALFYLHKKGVVHRDISPDNLMLTRDDMGEPQIKLIDLGIAKTVAGEQNLTATGVFVGKIRYASPEQFSPQDGAPVDHRADLYSLAVVLYELLTGVHPIRGDSFSRLIAGHLFQRPLDFDISDPDKTIPEQLRKVVLKALEKPVGDRFEDADRFRSHLLSLQKAHPWSAEALDHVLAPAAVERLERAPRPGSTQDRINRQFMGGAATPPPLSSVTDVKHGTGTTEVQQASAGQTQVDAVVAAAEHLVELELWQEAKLQLGSALKLQPDHSGALRLMAGIEEAETRAREVAEAVSVIEELIEKGNLEEAEHHVEMALGRLSGATELEGIQEWIHQLQRERRQAELRKLIEEAAAATQVGEHRRAVEHLEEAVELDPEDAEARRRLESARAAVARQEEEEKRAAALATAVKEVESLLTSDRFDDARARLQALVREVGEVEAIQNVMVRIDAAETTWRRAAVAALVRRGETLLGAGKLSEAVVAFEEGLRLQPEDGAAKSGLAQAREMVDEQRIQEAKGKAVAEVVAVVEDLIEKGDLDKAEVHVTTALGPLAGATEIEVIQERIASLRRERREAEVRNLMKEAEAATERGEHRQAVDQLEEAVRLAPRDAGALRNLESARAALARDEEEKRRAAVAATVLIEVEALLVDERFDDARERLEATVNEVGEVEALVDARGRIVAAETAWRQAGVAVLVQRGETLLEAGELSEAIDAFEEGLHLQPDDGAAKEGLARARKTMDELRARKAKKKTIAKAVNDVESTLARGKLDSAGKRLAKARDELGEDERFLALAGKLREAEATRELAKQVKTLLGQAEKSIARKDYSSAVATLELAADLDPANGTVQAHLGKARERLQETTAKTEAEAKAVETPPSDKTRPFERAEPSGKVKDQTIELAATRKMAAVKEKAVEEDDAVKVAAPAVAVDVEAPELEVALPTPTAEPDPRRKTRAPLVAAAVAIVATVAVVAVLIFRTPSTTVEDSGVAIGPPGTLIVSAVPWAQIVEVVDDEGIRVEIPGDAVTPLRLALPPGNYTVTMVGPGSNEPITLEGAVRAGETSRTALRLTDLDADAFLSKYGL